MAKPMKRAKELQVFVDDLIRSVTGKSNSESIKADLCVFCGKEAKTFRDDLSLKEYTISGLCQSCQDDVFRK